jgi:hypothetical protein
LRFYFNVPTLLTRQSLTLPPFLLSKTNSIVSLNVYSDAVFYPSGNCAFHGVEEGESKGDIKDDTAETGSHTGVEAHKALFGQDLAETVSDTRVLVSVNTLHFGLDNVDGVVEHGGAETCESTG